jgi:hypothetical protein
LTTPRNRNLAADRSLSTHDISQTFVAGWIAPIPIGKGKALLSGAYGFTQAILGGWQTNAILGGGCRPNSTGKSATLTGRVEDRLSRYFDTSQFTQPAPFNLR